MTDRLYISDYQGNEYIQGVFSVQNCQLGQTKNGKPFLKCMIGDKSGRTPGRMWNVTQAIFDTLPTDGFVYIQGNTQPYQGQVQVIIQNIKPHDPSPEELVDLLPCTQFDMEDMYAEVLGMIEEITHAPLKALMMTYVDDAELMHKFKQAPAAMALHHAFLGGLLEHTLQLMRLAKSICPLYPQINQEVVVCGLFLHDLGKCVELQWDSGFSYSDEGQLIGHIARGAIWLEQKAADCRAMGTDLSQPLVMTLQHIILSHHGRPEFGAAKLPATPEAILCNLIDNIDAKMQMANAAADRGSNKPDAGGNFTEKLWALETRIYKPDPTTI